MAQQKITIPIQFIDSGNSAAALASSLSATMSKSKLSSGIKDQITKIVGELQDYQEKVKKFKAGDIIDPKSFAKVYTEGKKMHGQVSDILKQITAEARSMGFSKEVIKQLEDIDTSVENSNKKIKANKKDRAGQQRLGDSVTYTNAKGESAPIPGFGNYKDITKVSEQATKFINEYNEKLVKLQLIQTQNPASLQAAEDVKNLEAQKVAVDATILKIEGRKKAQEALNLSDATENANITKQIALAAQLEATSTGTPLDPAEMNRLAEAQKKYDSALTGTSDQINAQGNKIKDTKTEYESAMNKLVDGKGNLISSVERLKKMGAKAKKSLPDTIVARAANTDESELLN